jgi:hypothetical protein
VVPDRATLLCLDRLSSMSAVYKFGAAFLLAALASPTPDSNPDWVIIPGSRVGAITSKCTLADVARAYGETNVRLKRDAGAIAIVLFPDDSLRRIEIALGDTINLRYPKSVTIRGSQSIWHTADGVTLGTTVDELQKLNLKPFEFNGFGWGDYGGQVVNWHGGTMSRDSAIVIRLDALHLFDNKPYRSVMGDKKVSSSNRLARELRPYVGEIAIRLASN